MIYDMKTKQKTQILENKKKGIEKEIKSITNKIKIESEEKRNVMNVLTSTK